MTELFDYTSQAPEQQETMNGKKLKEANRRPGRVRKSAKIFGALALAGGVATLGLKAKDLISDFSPHAEHKVELTVGSPESRVYQNVKLNLASIDSTFPVSLRTSLDRFGPVNCDTETDQKITTQTDAGMKVEKLEITKEKGNLTVKMDGNLALSNSSVNYDTNLVDVKGANGMDICVGTHEITSARHILDVTIQHSGGIAAACALESPIGEGVLKNSIAAFAVTTSEGAGFDPKKVNVSLNNSYDQDARSIYGAQVAGFNHEVDKVISDYLGETTDHAEPQTNFTQLMDCSTHTIVLDGDPTSQ